MTYEELVKINEEHKNNYLREIYPKDKYDNSYSYKFRIELYQNKYVIMGKNNEFVFSLESLNGFLEFYKKSDYYYITNLSSIKNKTRLYDIYMLSHSENSVLKQVINKECTNLCCKKVDNLNLVISKSILKGYKVILREICYAVLQDNKDNLYLYSDSMLRLYPDFSIKTFSHLWVKTLYIDNIDLSEQNSLLRFFAQDNYLESLYLRNLDFSNITDMTDMFFECMALKKIDFKNIKGGKNIVTTKFMFYNCKSLEEIDLSFLKVQSIKIMRGMFANCINLRKVDISTWNLSDLVEMKDIFHYCNSLIELRVESITELHNKGIWIYGIY